MGVSAPCPSLLMHHEEDSSHGTKERRSQTPNAQLLKQTNKPKKKNKQKERKKTRVPKVYLQLWLLININGLYLAGIC